MRNRDRQNIPMRTLKSRFDRRKRCFLRKAAALLLLAVMILVTACGSGKSSAGDNSGAGASAAAAGQEAPAAGASTAAAGQEAPAEQTKSAVPAEGEKNGGAASDDKKNGDSARVGKGGEAAPDAGGKKALTIMLYLCGSDLESKAGAGTNDLEEILASGLNTDAVNVAVMAGGTTQWRNGFSEEESAVYTVVSGADGSPAWEKKQAFQAPEQAEAPANMGEKETLQGFLDYSYEQFPAQKYALIMWDHGGGPMRGLCWDTAWAKDNLTMEEFTGAIAASPFAEEKLAWIGFDACLMSSVETAHLVAPYAEYMIASEETEPSLGWSYDFLKGIEEDPDGAATGTRIVDSFFEAAQAQDVESALTLSCTDLSKIQAVEQGLDGFFGVLSKSLDAEPFSELSNLRQDTREFGKAMNDSQRMDLVDLGDLVTHYSPEAPAEAEKLKKALEGAVIYNRSSLENCTGLSAYHPYYNKTYFEKVWQKEYDSFGFAPSYTDYINDFAKIWMSDSMGDWTQMSRVRSEGVTDDVQYFSVQLTPEQLQYYASAQLLVLSTIGNEDSSSGIAYSQVYTANDVTVDENGLLTAGYNGRTLYAVDDEGEAIAGPLRYEISDDGNLQIFGNYINNESGGGQRVVNAMFECSDAPSGSDLPLLDQYIYDVDANVWSNRLSINQEDYQELLLLNDYKEITYDGERILPFSQWQDSSWLGGFRVPLPESIRFRFFDQNLEGEELYACFQISDTQANQYGTELMPVENAYVSRILFAEGTPEDRTPGLNPDLDTITGTQRPSGEGQAEEEETGGSLYVLENDLFRMTLRGNLNTSENGKQMSITAKFENLSDRGLTLSTPDGFLLTDAARTCRCFPTRGKISFYDLKPGETETCTAEFNSAAVGRLARVEDLRLDMNCTIMATETGEEESAEETSGAGASAESGQASAPEEEERKITVELHPRNLDLTAISLLYDEKGKEKDAVLAEADEGPLHWELLDIGQMRDGDLYMILLCKNKGEEPVDITAPNKIAVNGIVLGTYGLSGVGNLVESNFTLESGMEGCLFLNAYNRQFETAYYEHLSGSQHLVVSDVLHSAGVENIRTVAFLQDDRAYSIDFSGEDQTQAPLTFTLRKQVPVQSRFAENDSGEESASDGESVSEGVTVGGQEAAAEDMTRALDSGGAAPAHTELFSRDDVTVYGEHLLVADRGILASVIVENNSRQNTVLFFKNWLINGEEPSGFDDGYISYAGTKKRIYLSRSLSEPEQTEDVDEEAGKAADQLEKASFCVLKKGPAGSEDGKDPFSVYEVSLAFPEGTAFNVDGAVSLSFDEIGKEVSCITDEAGTDPVMDPAVGCPQDPAGYRKTFTFSLPETLTAEQKASVGGVSLGIVRDCTGELDAEDKEKADASYQTISWIPMQEDEKEKGTYSGTYAGLACVLEDDPSVLFSATEDSSDPDRTDYLTLGSGSLCRWSMIPDPRIYDSMFGFDFTFRMSLENQKAEAKLSDFTIKDDTTGLRPAVWPTGWFTSMNVELGAPVYVKRDDGAMEYQTMGITRGSWTLPLDQGPLRVKLIPVTEYDSNIRILYSVRFEEGESLYFDGGEY